MYQMYIARGFRAGINGRLAAIGCRSLPLKSQEHCFHATRRSFPNVAHKVQSSSPRQVCLARCFSTSSSRLSDDGRLVYTGNLGKAVLGVKLFSYSSSAFSLCVMPYVLLKTGVGATSLALQAAFCGFIGFFTFVTPVCLHLITKGYVARLYHDPDTDTYTAVTYNVLLMEKKTVFRQSDVKIPPIARMFTSFYGGKTSLMVNPDLFPVPHDYNHLMGYDKPFTFDLDDLDKPDKS